jgi:hypothetical protein
MPYPTAPSMSAAAIRRRTIVAPSVPTMMMPTIGRCVGVSMKSGHVSIAAMAGPMGATAATARITIR